MILISTIMSSVGGGVLKIFQYCFPLASGVLENEAQSQSGLGTKRGTIMSSGGGVGGVQQ